MYVLYPIRHLYNFYGAEVNRGQGHHLAYLDVLIDNSNDILQKATVFAQALISISSDLFFAQEEISMLSLHVRRRSQYVADCVILYLDFLQTYNMQHVSMLYLF